MRIQFNYLMGEPSKEFDPVKRKLSFKNPILFNTGAGIFSPEGIEETINEIIDIVENYDTFMNNKSLADLRFKLPREDIMDILLDLLNKAYKMEATSIDDAEIKLKDRKRVLESHVSDHESPNVSVDFFPKKESRDIARVSRDTKNLVNLGKATGMFGDPLLESVKEDGYAKMD